ncbi:MAG: thioredoxin-dependent thiol peroxidase [bacterium]|nr:thioredoxin-dependent thiol peroxidase [bacterium]
MKKRRNFSLPDQNGKIHTLSDYKGQWVLVYFYPKDDTPGCNAEACAIRDNFPEFQKLGIRVFGISADPVKSHAKFAEKFNLPFTLISDEKRTTIKRWGAWQKKRAMGKTYMGIARMSFLIDPDGDIAITYGEVTPETHAQEVLDDLKELLNK